MKFLKTFKEINEADDKYYPMVLNEEDGYYPMNDDDDDEDHYSTPGEEYELEPGFVYRIFIDDDRTPGGSDIKADYGLDNHIFADGTLWVEGEKEDLEAYLDDYGIHYDSNDVTLVSGDLGWEKAY